MVLSTSILNLGMDRRAFVKNLAMVSIVAAANVSIAGSSDHKPSNHQSSALKKTISPVFAKAQGQELRLDGKPYRFIGVNRYNLLTPKGVDCGASFSDRDLEGWFNGLGKIGINVVRFWLFESIIKDDFEKFDLLLEFAAKNHIKIIPVFENEWADCSSVDQPKYAGEDGGKNGLWYQEGYQKSYKPYVERVVKKYRDNPNILMWQLMNEAISTDAVALRNFAQDMSARIRALDRNHLISLGTIGNDKDGIDEEDYRILHGDANMSLLEYHDYHEPQNPFPDTLAERFNDAQFLNKPLFIGEAGITVGHGMTAEGRAELFRAKMDAFFSRGGVGYTIWSSPNAHQTKSVSYGFVLSDPLVPVITEMAVRYCGFGKRG